MRRPLAILCLLFPLLWVACTTPTPPPATYQPLLLISVDGFRWDYCDLYADVTPHLRALRAQGVRARGLIPVYPSNTFPNHYSLVTGLRPLHHGMINNRMSDADTGEVFANWLPHVVRNPKWWGGEPIWITAERQGNRAACYFWPGSETTFRGVMASEWRAFNYSIPFDERLALVKAWTQRSPEHRPQLIAFYLEETNSAGHRHGPESPEVRDAVAQMDRQIGELLTAVRGNGAEPNVVIVSDHGMTTVPRQQTLYYDDYLDVTTFGADFDGPSLGVRPHTLDVDGWIAYARNRLPPAFTVVRTEDLPAHFFLAPHPRVPPVWVLCAPGWRLERRPDPAAPPRVVTLGEHGYDPALREMRGILLAQGPAFRSDGAELPEVENIHVYNLLCAVLGLSPAPNDGDDRLVEGFLR